MRLKVVWNRSRTDLICLNSLKPLRKHPRRLLLIDFRDDGPVTGYKRL
jgi:hypothetical protein